MALLSSPSPVLEGSSLLIIPPPPNEKGRVAYRAHGVPDFLSAPDFPGAARIFFRQPESAVRTKGNFLATLVPASSIMTWTRAASLAALLLRLQSTFCKSADRF